MDLSSPSECSVNNGISKELCSFHYTSVDEAAKKMVLLGKGALLAKMDVKQANCNVPVVPEDRYLLGLMWDNKIYVDQMLSNFSEPTTTYIYPVAALLTWLVNMGNAPGPLFQFSSEAPLTRATFVVELKKAITKSGHSPEGFSGHSFCAVLLHISIVNRQRLSQ